MKTSLTAFFLATPWLAAFAASATESNPASALHEWINGRPGGVVLAMVDREGTRFVSDGAFSRSDPRPVGPDTFFEAGSVTKSFTALLLADAMQRGELRLGDRIAARTGLAVPESITFEQLATHRSGLPRLPRGFAPGNRLDPYADQDETAVLAALEGLALPEAAGHFEYSNLGVAVLGIALARNADRPYAELLRERVLVPLGMEESSLDWRTVDRARLAPGHSGNAPASNWTFTAYAAVGGLVTTARELARYVEVALRHGKETPLDASFALSLEPRAETDRDGVRIGLAWMIETRPEGVVITWHNGGTGGYRSFVGLDRAARRGIVLLTNHDVALEPLAFSLLSGKPVEPAARGETSTDLAGYAGCYPLAPSFVMNVTAESTRLFVQATGQPRLELCAAGPDRFEVLGVDARISFARDSAGRVEALVLHQNGVDQRAPRREQADPPRAEVKLDAAILADYRGHYPLAPGFELTVTVEGDGLFVQATGQEKFPVFAEAKDQFFYRVVDAQLSFERDGEGRVTGLVLHQNGRHLPGRRAGP